MSHSRPNFSITSFQIIPTTEKIAFRIPKAVPNPRSPELDPDSDDGMRSNRGEEPRWEMKMRMAKQCVTSTLSMDSRLGHLNNCKMLNLSSSHAPTKAHQEVMDPSDMEQPSHRHQVNGETLKGGVHPLRAQIQS